MPENLATLKLEFRRVRSSQIEQLAHDEATNTLYAKFVGTSLYSYENVPRSEYEAVLYADSVGAGFNQRIKKGAYKYEKLPLNHEAWSSLLPAEEVAQA